MPAQALVVQAGKTVPHKGRPRDGKGVNFALFSEHAEKVELRPFDARGRRETARIEMRERTDQVFHCYLPGVQPGQLYGFRTYGPYEPSHGHRFNPTKLLLDPYARAIHGKLRMGRLDVRLQDRPWRDARSFAGRPRLRRGSCPKARWSTLVRLGRRPAPDIPWHNTLIYELHVKGFTTLHPDVPAALRGTYAGLASAPAIEHLKRLGVTAVELMPVQVSSTTAIWWSEGCTTTGATTPSASSRRSDAIQRGANGRSVERVQDAWSRRCTARASR